MDKEARSLFVGPGKEGKRLSQVKKEATFLLPSLAWKKKGRETVSFTLTATQETKLQNKYL